jgi:hypothetical protein
LIFAFKDERTNIAHGWPLSDLRVQGGRYEYRSRMPLFDLAFTDGRKHVARDGRFGDLRIQARMQKNAMAVPDCRPDFRSHGRTREYRHGGRCSVYAATGKCKNSLRPWTVAF